MGRMPEEIALVHRVGTWPQAEMHLLKKAYSKLSDAFIRQTRGAAKKVGSLEVPRPPINRPMSAAEIERLAEGTKKPH